MKRLALILAMASIGLGGTWVAAQTTPETPKAKVTAPRTPRAGNNQMMGNRWPGYGGMMGGGPGMGYGWMMDGGAGYGGMMGGGMMGPLMMSPGMHIEVTNQAKGVTITLTNDDPAVVARLQKMAEAMRLMHDAMVQ